MVLKMLEEGKINAEQAAALLRALSEADADAAGTGGHARVAGEGGRSDDAGEGGRSEDAGEGGRAIDADLFRVAQRVARRSAERFARHGEMLAEVGERLAEKGERLAERGERWAERLAERLEAGLEGLPRIVSLFDGGVFGIFGPEAEDVVERRFPATPGATLNLVVETANGRIEIAGTERDDVLVRLVKRARGSDQDRAAERAKSMGRIEVDGATLRVSLGEDVGNGGGCRMHVRIEVPRGTTVAGRARTSNGRVDLRDLFGAEFSAETMNGHVEARRLVGGRWTVRTHNGHLEFEDVDASVEGRTYNGALEWRAGRLTADREVRLTTYNGAVRASLPDCGFDVMAETRAGRVDVPSREFETAREFGRRRVRGRRAGQPALRFEAATHNGSITIDVAGEGKEAAANASAQ